MTFYTAHANLTTIGDDRATARRRFDRFMRQFVAEKLITRYSLDEPGDMEQDMEGPATWMSEAKIEFESEHEWPEDPDDALSEEEWEALLEPLKSDLARVQARMAERLEEESNVDYDYFNHQGLTFEDLEPVDSEAA
jgi:hypothetical protein